MIHTYSLIHDDLPQMDDDDLRRGIPTLHVKAGVPQAVLAGDLLLVEAFGELARTPVGAARICEMAARLGSAAGPVFLVGGQYLDMYPPEDADLPWVERMVLGKTAAMIRVSLELGALAGGADFDLVDALKGVGDRLGYLFQLTDDILDRSGTTDEMGKRVGKDADQGKANTVAAMGLEKAKTLALRLSDEISSDLQRRRGDWSAVALLARYLPHRRS
jgi:geranylgeranyl pyrophosphate synthase